MADRPQDQPALSEHEKAAAEVLAKEVAALLRPILEERNRRLGEMCEQIDAVTTELSGACASLARLAEATLSTGQPTRREGPE